MQGYYLTNLAGVSVVAILFSAISLGAIAEQEPALESGPSHTLSEKSSEASLPLPEEMKPNVGESTIESQGMQDEVYKEMLEGETQGVETPRYTPEESQAIERLNKLNEIDQMNAGSQLELSDLPNQDQVNPGVEQEDGRPETLAPQAPLPTETPTASIMNSGGAKFQGVVTPTAWDDEDSREQQKEEDPKDPTSEGQGPGGEHKMGKMRQTGPIIPIIRMGENSEENSSFTIIKPWNS